MFRGGRNVKNKKITWCQRRTNIEKILITAISLLSIILITVLCLKFIPNGEDLCMTSSCVKSASEILQKVDLHVDPCIDFYNFACGKFVRDTFLPEYKSSISSFSIVSDMVEEQIRSILEKPITATDTKSAILVKSYYRSCMNTTQIELESLYYIKQLFRKTGGWPVVEGVRWDGATLDWKDTLYNFRKIGFTTDMFFSFVVSTDSKNSTRSLINLDQPYIPFEKLMLKGLNEKIVKAYLNYIVKVVELFGAERRRALTEVREMIELDIVLAQILVPQEERRNYSLEYNPMTIKELEEKYTYLPWLKFINTMIYPVKQLNYDDIVIVLVPSYFKKLENILKNTSLRTLSNYMYWGAMKGLINYLSNDIRNLKLEFSKIASGRTEREPRWKECSNQVTTNLHAASGNLYVKNFFNKEAKQNMEVLVENIQSQFIKTLMDLDWMDNITKKQALEKAHAIYKHIAYPDQLAIDEKINDYYRNLTITSDNYLQTYLNLSLFEQEINYDNLNKIVNKKDWTRHTYAIVTNAFYEESENSIEFPSGILQGVFFNNDRPNYLNYGAIGQIIGHEITHGFDDEGRQYDKDGNLRQWWMSETEKAFKKKAQCIIEQYSNITVSQVNIKINGINTQGENIADNGGIKQAYWAYKKWLKENGPEPALPGLPYTSEQMFWISAGNTWCFKQRSEQLKLDLLSENHAPNYYRVNVPLMNNHDFARDFDCKIGSPMNPFEKCSIW